MDLWCVWQFPPQAEAQVLCHTTNISLQLSQCCALVLRNLMLRFQPSLEANWINQFLLGIEINSLSARWVKTSQSISAVLFPWILLQWVAEGKIRGKAEPAACLALWGGKKHTHNLFFIASWWIWIQLHAEENCCSQSELSSASSKHNGF